LNKLITIITATYNSSKGLEQCIRSVLSQTYSEIEYIIIDNCSTDHTLDIAKSYSEKISRIISEPDNGIFDALNKGIKIASGNVIGFLHADDFYASSTIIEEVMMKFEATGADSVYGDLQYVSKNNPEKLIRNWIAGEFQRKKLLNGWMPPHPSFFIRRKCYTNYGLFNTNYQIAADYDLILRFLGKHEISTVYLPKVLVKMSTGGKSNKSIKNILKKSKEDFKALKENEIGNFYTLFLKNIRKLNQFF
jgi:glycosyltransferase involved in cell wall biosynthesis